MFKNYILFLIALGLNLNLNAQKQKQSPRTKIIKFEKMGEMGSLVQKGRTDSLSKGLSNPNSVKPYQDIITNRAKSRFGMIAVHKVEEKYFFEIPDSILNRDILVVNRISAAPAGLRPQNHIYGGDQIAEHVISFEKGPDNKILIKRRTFSHLSYSG